MCVLYVGIVYTCMYCMLCIMCVLWYICNYLCMCFLDLVAHTAIGLCAFSGRLSLPSNFLSVEKVYEKRLEKLGKGISSRNVNVMGVQMTLPCISYKWCRQFVGEGHVLASPCMFSNLLGCGPVKHLQSASLWKSKLTIPFTFAFFLIQVSLIAGRCLRHLGSPFVFLGTSLPVCGCRTSKLCHALGLSFQL